MPSMSSPRPQIGGGSDRSLCCFWRRTWWIECTVISVVERYFSNVSGSGAVSGYALFRGSGTSRWYVERSVVVGVRRDERNRHSEDGADAER